MTGDVFLYGILCHPPLIGTVLGRAVSGEAAQLADHSVVWAQGQLQAQLQPNLGGTANGTVIRGLSAGDLDRIEFYCAALGQTPRILTIETGAGQVQARVYAAPAEQTHGAPWRLDDWQAQVGQMVTATAGDVMALFGQVPAAQVSARYGVMLVRGAARVRAQDAAPTRVRRTMAKGDISVEALCQPYAKFFAVEEYRMRYLQFDGAFSPSITRAAFISADAVTVVPYDPVRDRVLLIEQFRIGPFARGDTEPWMLEPIAGRIDPGETPQEAARREAVEEAGLTLGDLIQVAAYYPSPGVKTEFIYSYVALCDLPDDSAGVFGAADEAEDIRGHLMPFDALMALIASGEAAVGPLVLTGLWLQRERGRLRG